MKLKFVDFQNFYNFKVKAPSSPIFASQDFTVIIESYDNNDNLVNFGGQNFSAFILNSSEKIIPIIQDHRNGTYSVNLISFKKGNFTLNISYFDFEAKIYKIIPSTNFSNFNIFGVLAYKCSAKLSSLKLNDICVIKTPCMFELSCVDDFGNLVEESDRSFINDEFEVKLVFFLKLNSGKISTVSHNSADFLQKNLNHIH